MPRNHSIMIVDDDPIIGMMVCRHLHNEGDFETHYFEDPQIALKQVPKLKPDMIILDWTMPELSGLHFLLHIRRDKKLKNTPIFMLTAKQRGADFEVACQAGVDGYLTKPIDFKTLHTRIIRHFSQQMTNA